MDLTRIKRIETTGSTAIVNQRIKAGGYLIAAVYKVSYIEYHLGFTDFTACEQGNHRSSQDGIPQSPNHPDESRLLKSEEFSNQPSDTSESIQGQLSRQPL